MCSAKLLSGVAVFTSLKQLSPLFVSNPVESEMGLRSLTKKRIRSLALSDSRQKARESGDGLRWVGLDPRCSLEFDARYVCIEL